MALEVIAIQPNTSPLKLSVMIKDGKDCILSDPYEVVLPAQTCDTQSGNIIR